MNYLHFSELANIIQNDIKPENIMLDTETYDIKVIDFGLKKKIGEPRNKNKTEGTPEYYDRNEHKNKDYHDMNDDLFKILILPLIVTEGVNKDDDGKGRFDLYRNFYNFYVYINKLNNFPKENMKIYTLNVYKLMKYFINSYLDYRAEHPKRIFSFINSTPEQRIDFVFKLFEKDGIKDEYLENFQITGYSEYSDYMSNINKRNK